MGMQLQPPCLLSQIAGPRSLVCKSISSVTFKVVLHLTLGSNRLVSSPNLLQPSTSVIGLIALVAAETCITNPYKRHTMPIFFQTPQSICLARRGALGEVSRSHVPNQNLRQQRTTPNGDA